MGIKSWIVALFSVLAGACAGGDGSAVDDACETAACATGSSGASSATLTGGPNEGTGTSADGGTQSDTQSAGDSTGEGGGQVPCDVQEFLDANCWMCHAAMPKFGAPMPLVSLTDFEVPAVSNVAVPVHEMVAQRLVDDVKPMPATGQLSAAERSAIESWIDAGRPPAPIEQCDIGGDESGSDTGDPSELPCDNPILFGAHAAGSNDGFHVPQVNDLYQCFVIENPFAADEQGIAWGAEIVDDRVVHHMLLLTGNTAGYSPGDLIPNCSSLTLDTNMLMGWGPGSGIFQMPPEAGLELPNPGQHLILQIHYNNTAGYDDAVDGSGFRVCATDEPRPQVAATLWLGTTSIAVGPNSMGSAMGECNTSGVGGEFTMLMSWPHMHQHGRQFVTELHRQGGGVEPVVTVGAYSFDNQIYYPHDPAIVVQPGDTLRTTCTYNNTTGSFVGFGEGTAQEMCFNFATVYPISLFDGQGRQCVSGLF